VFSCEKIPEAQKQLFDQVRDARILLVGQDLREMEALARSMVQDGYSQVECSMDAGAAAAEMETLSPDLVVLDLSLEAEETFRLLDSVRTLGSEEGSLPTLVLTGEMDRRLRRRALASGATELLTKPFGIQEALSRMETLLEIRMLHQRLASRNPGLEWRVRQRTMELTETQGDLTPLFAAGGSIVLEASA
jgi:putative two-component system response regulator